MGARLGVSHMMVARVWAKHGLKPRLDRYMASSDPDFEAKAADIIGLYLNPPQHAAWTKRRRSRPRTVPVLPLSPGRAERRFEPPPWHAVAVQYPKVLGKTAEATPRRSLCLSGGLGGKSAPPRISMSSPTISPPTRPRWSGGPCMRPPTRPGSTKSSCGSAKSNATSSRAASSPP